MNKAIRVVGMFSLCATFLFAFATQVSAHAVNPGNQCVVHVAPLSAGQSTSKIISSECFQTFSEAIVNATGGRVHLANTIEPHNLTQAMLNASPSIALSSYVLSVEYSDWHYQGATFTISGSLPCNQVGGYGMSYVGNDWNDVISSSIGYSNCNHVIHWDNANYGGSNIDCNSSCYSMGAMNDHTSSIQWHQ